MNKILSIIIPVFNVENEFQDLLVSLSEILKIRKKELEIIIVDDGSTDSSLLVAQKFQRKWHDTVAVFHKKNNGLSDTRNFGFKQATGEFTWFLDSDDLFHVDNLNRLISLLNEKRCSNLDVVHFNNFLFTDVDQLTKRSEKSDFSDFEILTGKQMLQKLSRSEVENFAWSFVTRSSLLRKNNIEFPVNRNYEDVGTTYKIFNASQQILNLNCTLYYYRYRNGSIVNNGKVKDVDDILDSIDEKKEYFKKQSELKEPYVQLLLFKDLFLTFLRLRKVQSVLSPQLFQQKMANILNEMRMLKVQRWPVKQKVARIMFLSRGYVIAFKMYDLLKKVLAKVRK